MALKIVKSERHYTEAAVDEIKLLERVTHCMPTGSSSVDISLHGSSKDDYGSRVVQLLDHFKIYGPHGMHICMVFEVLGQNLLRLIRFYNYEGIPLPMAKKIAKQILQGLCFLHEKATIIHTDLKPENVLLSLDSKKEVLTQWLLQLAASNPKDPDPMSIEKFVSLPLGIFKRLCSLRRLFFMFLCA